MNSKDKPKIIVAHPGKQHSFKTAEALQNSDLLFMYITTVYIKDETFLSNIMKLFLGDDNKIRMKNRKSDILKDNKVLQFCTLFGIIEIILSRYDKKGKVYRWWHGITSKQFGKKVAKYAIDNNVDGVIMYNTNSKECFRILNDKRPDIKRIMDVAAANRNYMKNIYEKDMQRTPQFADKLKKEVWHCWDDKIMSYNREEIKLTEYFNVPSNFVKESLLYDGVQANKILITPYGANFKYDCTEFESKRENDILKIIYVGNVTQLKGIYYLLEGLYSFEDIEVTIVGNYDNSSGVFDKYINKYNFVGRVTHDKIQYYLNSSDVFVFPSLGEGMSLAAIEAMGCGLPLICSTNSGVNDYIIDGVNGFVIPIGVVSRSLCK